MTPVLAHFNLSNPDQLYAEVGYDSTAMPVGKVFGKRRDEYIKRLSEEERLALGYRTASDGQLVYSKPLNKKEDDAKDQTKSLLAASERPAPRNASNKIKDEGIVVGGLHHMALKMANCCHPVPGDDIIGYVTQSEGITIHKQTCPNIVHIKEAKENSDRDRQKFERLVKATWDESKLGGKGTFTSNIVTLARDVSLTKFFADVAAAFNEEHIEVQDLKSPRKIGGDFTEFVIEANFKDKEQLNRIMGRLKNLDYVTNVYRK